MNLVFCSDTRIIYVECCEYIEHPISINLGWTKLRRGTRDFDLCACLVEISHVVIFYVWIEGPRIFDHPVCFVCDTGHVSKSTKSWSKGVAFVEHLLLISLTLCGMFRVSWIWDAIALVRNFLRSSLVELECVQCHWCVNRMIEEAISFNNKRGVSYPNVMTMLNRRYHKLSLWSIAWWRQGEKLGPDRMLLRRCRLFSF